MENIQEIINSHYLYVLGWVLFSILQIIKKNLSATIQGWLVNIQRWKTGKPGMLQSVGLRRVGQDLGTKHQQQIQSTEIFSKPW